MLKNIILEKEHLTVNQQYNEYVMTSLRTSWGCDTIHIKNVFGNTFVEAFDKTALEFINSSKITKQGNIYRLTKHGKLFADGIASDLFIF